MTKTELAQDRPTKYVSDVVNGANQNKFALLRFLTPKKKQVRNVNRITIISALENGSHPASRILNNDQWGMFDKIEATFLAVGHTHFNIDQNLSTTSHLRREHESITVRDSHQELLQYFNGRTKETSMNNFKNGLELSEKTSSVIKVKNITFYRFLHFYLSSET